MELLVTTLNETETRELGERFAALLEGGSVVLLDGCLGAGKTQFAKGVARGLGVEQPLTSPTFNLVLEYPLAGERGKEQPSAQPQEQLAPLALQVLRHFDLYRLECAEQLDDLDYFGLIEDEEAVSLVEWGSKFPESLPLNYIRVNIEPDEENLEQRLVELSVQGAALEHSAEQGAYAGQSTARSASLEGMLARFAALEEARQQ